MRWLLRSPCPPCPEGPAAARGAGVGGTGRRVSWAANTEPKPMNRRPHSASRRQLLKSGLALGAAAALPAWYRDEVLAQDAPAQPKSPNDRLGIGLVGCGGRG